MGKQCSKCRDILPIYKFGQRKRNSDGLRSQCKDCESKTNKEIRQRKLEEDYLGTRLKERKNNLKRMFGMSIEEYDKKLDDQGGGCKLCGLECISGKRLAVDHDHKTGKIRDLLCNNCNAGLGKFQDNPELLIKAADYLRKHSG
jgi:hypothetical protein